ncbi:unnamed protein product [Pieris brassicae]|uniref:Guanylate cyclase n=1 Tax=Pieris brassicae TaxID=7116 RepID=A0A9P0SQH7_PIEBR|nr:unnamed protein product [Pieris brassicae]
MLAAALATLSTFAALVVATTAAAPLLLVLRSACRFNDTFLFSETALENFIASSGGITPPRPFTVLNYNETCGTGWQQHVATAGLKIAVQGGIVISAGWGGAALCGALSMLSRAPASCAEPHARAASLAALALRLRWRSATLLVAHRHQQSDLCTSILTEVERALLNIGLQLRQTDIQSKYNEQTHISILCDDRNYDEQDKKYGVHPVLIVRRPFVSTIMPSARHRSFAYIYDNLKLHNDLNNNTQANISPRSTRNDSERQLEWAEIFQFYRVNSTRSPASVASVDIDNAMKQNTNSIGLNAADYINSLVFIERAPIDTYTYLLEAPYNNTGSIMYSFDIYESRMIEGSATWELVTISLTETTQSADDSWHTDVRWEGGSEFETWCINHAEVNQEIGVERLPGEAVCAVGAAGAAGAVLAAVMVTVVVLRRAMSWRHGVRRRPRTAVVLAPVDFEFPAEEQRRVGEGMESVLSWLQQLHELPDQPDLLKRPLAPSAPSSVCSVSRLSPDGRIRYKGDPVHMKYLPVATLELKRKAIDVLLVMQSLRHENLNIFIGCVSVARPALVYGAGARGSLQAVLQADELRLDWTFRLSLLTDLVRGMRYLHASPLRAHGCLTSRACLVDARWVLRVSDYGVAQLGHAQAMPIGLRCPRDLLWCAPEVLRVGDTMPPTQSADVFSFSIIMQEVIVRGEPYCMLSFTPEEIVEKLCRPPPLIRPSVSMGAAPPEAVSIMRQCWSEQPEHRPDFDRLHEVFRQLHSGRKVNIMDSMFEMLEKYSNNLEELIKERTEQLDIEKKKTEQLLNRMLPRTVAERLLLGLRVEPEMFEEVSIYFSDIVGFTSIAARATPVQVVDLLNDLYTTFDAAIEQYAVYKVETIGDAYMVVGGLPIRSTDHAQAVATMALHLLHLAGRFRIRYSPSTPLHLRIGLHTGPCCAGVVGLTMPRYCLFGDTVNTASRMESTGAAWRVQVSTATAERLAAAGGFRLRSRGLTQIKGKGAMHTYWLLGKEGFDKPLPTPPPLESEEVLFETDGENDSESSDISNVVNLGRTLTAPQQTVERQSSDPCAQFLGEGGQGALSAESSPCLRSAVDGLRGSATLGKSMAISGRSGAGAARFRYLRSSLSSCSVAGSLEAPAPRVLRRQWSLERGDSLAAAAAGPDSGSQALEPLALRAPPPRPAPPRYRTRADTER